MQKIQALPARWNGYSFRSTNEAYWGPFFEYLDISFEYEREGYKIYPNGEFTPDFYRPDFWFPKNQIYGEVKPIRGDLKQEVDIVQETLRDMTDTLHTLRGWTDQLHEVFQKTINRPIQEDDYRSVMNLSEHYPTILFHGNPAYGYYASLIIYPGMPLEPLFFNSVTENRVYLQTGLYEIRGGISLLSNRSNLTLDDIKNASIYSREHIYDHQTKELKIPNAFVN